MKKASAIVLALAILLSSVSVCFAAERIDYDRPDITNSEMALLYEETTDTYMYLKNDTELNAPASMTKVMTAILVLENDPDLSGEMEVSSKAVSYQYCSWMDKFHLKWGEIVTVSELMDYLLIVSANEAATTLAEFVAGDIETFVGMMNDKAKELGMNDTVYYDPHGLSARNKITCRDMLTLCRYAMQNETFREIVSKPGGVLSANNLRSTPHYFESFNGVMFPGHYEEYKTGFEQDICGIKTGYISESGNNFSSHMQHGDLSFYAVTMHAFDKKNDQGNWVEYQFADMASLFRWARSYQKAGYAAGQEIKGVTGTLLGGMNVNAAPETDVYTLTQDGALDYDIQAPGLLFSVKKGDRVGTITLLDDFGNLKTAELIATSDASTPPIMIAAFLLLVAMIIIMIRVLSKGAKRRRAERKEFSQAQQLEQKE